MMHQPNGDQWVWFSGAKHTDPLQGPSYHVSKTLDAASGTCHATCNTTNSKVQPQ